MWRGGLQQEEGDAKGAVATWTQVRDTYGQDEPAAFVVARALGAIGSVSTGRAREDALAEIASRRGASAQPELRRLAVNALLARDATEGGGSASIDTVADAYRNDPDAVIARASAQARVDRWLSRRPRIAAGLHGRVLRALVVAFIAVRQRHSRGVEYPELSES